MVRWTTRVLLSVVAVVFLVVGGCGSDDDDGGTAGTAPAASEPTTGAETVEVDVYFADQERFRTGEEPYERAVRRQVDAADPIQGAVDALFVGPTADESATGLVFVPSGATGASVEVTDGIARVQLEGGCSSGGSTLTIATSLVPTVQQFDGVTAVKILDPQGATGEPDGEEDSIPECLNP